MSEIKFKCVCVLTSSIQSQNNTAALLISCADAHRQASKRSRTHTQLSSLSPAITHKPSASCMYIQKTSFPVAETWMCVTHLSIASGVQWPTDIKSSFSSGWQQQKKNSRYKVSAGHQWKVTQNRIGHTDTRGWWANTTDFNPHPSWPSPSFPFLWFAPISRGTAAALLTPDKLTIGAC